MFTGIVQDVGRILALDQLGGDTRLTVGVERLELARSAIGDSIAVAGVCLTAVALEPRAFSADVSRETLAFTTIGDWRVGQRVNLEPALRAGDALGGHLVSGHVDGVAEVRARIDEARSQRFRIRLPQPLARYVARKGSVALDGVSLTVNTVEQQEFEVNLIPHTLAMTTLSGLAVGDRVNLEVDLIARYTERLLAAAS
jgi:riboflavin synthase